MAYTFKTTPYGTVETYQDGKRISTGTAEYAKTAYGYTGDATQVTPTAPVPSTQPPLPSSTPVTAPTPPATTQPGTNLVTFKDSLDQAIQLARTKKNDISLKFMAPFSGTTTASDFNGILSNLNSASDTTIQDIPGNETTERSIYHHKQPSP